MKANISLLVLLLSATVILTACGDDDESSTTPSPAGGIASGKLEFPALHGSGSIVVTHTATLNDATGAEGTNYSVEWDTEKHAQRWSCYKMYALVNANKVSRYYTTDKTLSASGQYPNDPDLPAEYHFTSDPFWGSGYDHGHICPSYDRVCSKQANYQTFFMTNMMPQGNDFNAGIWASMEAQVRSWAAKYDTLYVCKGGTIDRSDHIIRYLGSGSNKIPVPRFFYMAVLGRYKDTFRATGYWINQESYYSNTPKTYMVSIAELQKNTGIDFFCNLPDDIETQVENVSRTQMESEWYQK